MLYLLHGAGENYRTWVDKTKADEVTADLPAIVVMPDAATGFYTNHFNGGRRGAPGWERYFLDEVIPAVEQRFPIRPERRWHAVAGFSMGGFGTAYLASQLPGYFGSVGPMSGFLAPRRAEMPIAFDYATGQSYQAIYGPPDGAYVEGHDPVALARQPAPPPHVRHHRRRHPGPAVQPPSNPQSIVTGSIGEADLRFHSEDFAVALRERRRRRRRSPSCAGSTTTRTGTTTCAGCWLGTRSSRCTERARPLELQDDRRPRPGLERHLPFRSAARGGRRRSSATARSTPPPVPGPSSCAPPTARGLRVALPFKAQPLRRALRLKVLGRRGSTVRVRLRAEEFVTARIGARVARRGRTRAAARRDRRARGRRAEDRGAAHSARRRCAHAPRSRARARRRPSRRLRRPALVDRRRDTPAPVSDAPVKLPEWVFVDRITRFSLDIEPESGRTFVGIPVSNSYADYDEWYEIDRATFDAYLADPLSAHEFVERAKRRELDHLLLLEPGTDRGWA